MGPVLFCSAALKTMARDKNAMDVTSLKQIGPYVVERFIDCGAFAWVFEVADPKFAGRRLALKMLMPEAAAGEEFRRFQSEARLLAQIDHPSVVTIFDFGRDEVTGNSYYVMTYVDGPTLKQRLKEGPLPADEALPIFVDLLDGLARLHEKGIVHRDIKPANILLGRDGRARLADLGIARVQAERGQTRTGVAVGTALYMSPEQARGREVDPRSDLFSLGLTLYETLTGNIIYDYVESVDSSSGMDVLMYIGSLVHTRTEFEIRFDPDPTVSPAVQRIILKALRLSPDDRFPSALAMRDALRAAASGEGPPIAHHASRGVSPERLLRGGAALAAVLIAAGLYFFYWSPLQRQAAQRTEATQRLADVRVLSEQAITVTSGARDLSPAPPEDLLEQVEEQLDRADRYLEDGAADLQAGGLQLALKNLERGSAQYTEACRVLTDRLLAPRASKSSSTLRQRAIGLSDLGAQEVAGRAWQPLAALLSQVAEAPQAVAGCGQAEAQLARLVSAAEGAPLADAVARDMGEVWPKLVGEAYERAITARLVAVAVPTRALEYKVELKRAKRLLLHGSRYLQKGDHRTARDAYLSAEQGFRTAAAIAPSALARDEARALSEQTAREGGADSAAAAELIAGGEEAYSAERWPRAEELFKQAIVEIKELRAANEWRRAAAKAQRGALAARDEALAEGADKSAPTEFAQAEVSMSGSERALENGDAKRAELGFVSARDEYAAAQKRAIQSLRDAGMKRAAVVVAGEKLAGEGGCGALQSDDARGQCEQAVASLEVGTASLEQRDAPAASRNFNAARESYARAQSTQVLWEMTRPRPPVLVRRVPQRPVVKVSPRQLRSFAVEASDPNGDLLSYTWSIDGRVQQESGPAIKRRLEQGVLVTVKVDDGRGGELVEQWRVEVAEPAPGAGSN